MPPHAAGEDADRIALRDHLVNRDEPCPACGYNLRGLSGARCPECNETLVLRVGIAEPRLGMFIAAMSGLAAISGGCLICLLLGLYMSLRYGLPREIGAVFVLPGVLLVTTGVLGGLLARPRGRRWFRGLDRAKRRCVVAGAWAGVPLSVMAFIVLMGR